MVARKLQKFGTVTLTISLPKKWVRQRNLKKGDQVFVIVEGDSLRILPGPTAEDLKTKWKKYIIDADQCSEPGLLERVVVGNYLLGRHELVVQSATRLRSEDVEGLRAVSKKLMGLGIIEETANTMTLQCSLDPASYPFNDLIRRFCELGVTMLEEAIEALVTGDRHLAEDAIQREEDADSMYWLILRLVQSAQVETPSAESVELQSPLEITQYQLVNRNLEAFADSGQSVAHSVLALLDAKIGLSPSLATNLKELAAAVEEIYSKAIGGLVSRDIQQVNDALRQQESIASRGNGIVKTILKDFEDPKVAIHLRAMLDGILAMFEYGRAIAVIAFNRYLEQPTSISRPEGPMDESPGNDLRDA